MKYKLELLGAGASGQDEILTEGALAFINALTDEFRPRVEALLAARAERQEAINKGEMPDFLAETQSIRESEWQVCAIPDIQIP